MALTDNAGKKYTNEHPKFSIEANKAEAENVKEATYRPGINYRDIEKLPGSSIKDKLEKKLGIKVMPNITLEEAIKLLNKKNR
jgi:hypothetical protein